MKLSFHNLTLIFFVSITLARCGEPMESPVEESADPVVEAAPIPLVARHGMSSSDYQSEFDYWYAQGFRLTHVSGYDVGGQPQFAATWEKKSGPAFVARHGMTSAQYQSEFDYWTGLGFRPILVDGYESGGVERYVAIWEQSTVQGWVARHGLSASQLQAELDLRASQGYRVLHLEGYRVGNVARYAAIWEMVNGAPHRVVHHGLTASQYSAEVSKAALSGYRVVHVSGYQVGNYQYFAAIFEQGIKHFIERHGLSFGGYQHWFTDLAFQGFRLKRVDGYAVGNEARYAAIWEAEATALDGDYCKNSMCFDLERVADGIEAKLAGNVVKYGFELRRGTKVIQRADGPARTLADLPSLNFSVFERFNPASVSKQVTATAILQLMTKLNVSMNAQAHLYLPSTWNIPPNNRTITIAQLLNHTSGLREPNGGGFELHHVKKLMEHEIALIDKKYSYDNANYAVLRVIVASLDGYTDWNNTNAGANSAQRFIDYVNAHIFAPLGIYNVQYKPDAEAPVLFYPNPPLSANGTHYGDWTLRAGPAGVHLSVHELAMFGAGMFNGKLLAEPALDAAKQHNLAVYNYGLLADGSQCWGHAGGFPGSHNGGAELGTSLITCENGVTVMLLLNGVFNSDAAVINSMNEAFVPQRTAEGEPINPIPVEES